MGNELVDFSECEFISSELRFYTYTDFCQTCGAIKRLYKTLSKNGRIFYKWYVYANTHMKNNFKNAIWDYLNNDDKSYYEHLQNLQKQYKPL